MDEKRQRKQNVTFIVLGTRNLGEKDKLVFLYTKKYGLLHTIAKNSRKITSKFTGKLIQLSCGKAEIYFGPKKILITEINSKNIIGDEKDLSTIQYAQEIANITKQITPENQTHDHLIELIKTTITHIKSTNKKDIIYATFIIKLFDTAGLIPDFKKIYKSIDIKYLKFFNFLKTKKFTEIEKLFLTKEETQFINIKIESLIENTIN